MRFRPDLAVTSDPAAETSLRDKLAAAGLPTRVAAGATGLHEAAAGELSDTVIAAIVGAAGLESTLAAARAGKRLLLANKEPVVMAGALLLDALRSGGGDLIPIDSEHNAIFQCLPHGRANLAGAGARRIMLTASGGPFRGKRRADLARVTPDEACAHPKWRMGRKISVDSATLMNKGLEVIEAHWLFGADAGQIEVVVHPESIVHSLVEYPDGSVLAQLGNPDMRTALAQALAWPERIDSGVPALDPPATGRQLDFEAPDRETFRQPRPGLSGTGEQVARLRPSTQCSQRGRRRRVPRRYPAVPCHRRGHRGHPGNIAGNCGKRDLETVVCADSMARKEAQRVIQRSFC